MIPSFKEALDRGSKPRVHPNGFIQLDLDTRTRMHVWHPNLPYRQKTYSPVHNHIFGFDSVVLAGRLHNVRYEPWRVDLGTHEMWQVQAIAGNDTVLMKNPDRFDLRPHQRADTVQEGDGYHIDPYEFHETLSNEPTVTVMTKLGDNLTVGPNCLGASVMVPYGEQPDNDFRRDAVEQEVLWKLMTEALQRIT